MVGLILSVRFGIIGLMIGIYLGNSIDEAINKQGKKTKSKIKRPNQWNPKALQYTYQLMGHLAKFDGSVSQKSIEIVESSMLQFQLSSAQIKEAKLAFNQGKQDQFNPFITVQQLQISLLIHPGKRSSIARALIQLVDENPSRSNEKIARLDYLLKNIGVVRFHKNTHNAASTKEQYHLSWAYQVLGVSANTTPNEVKRKYRKLLSDHHPDKIHAKNQTASENDIKKANEKTFEIKKAYNLIKANFAESKA